MTKVSLKKISIGAIYKTVNKHTVKKAMESLDNGDEIIIGEVLGQVHGHGVKTTDYGDSTFLKGMFKFIDQNGDEYHAPVCYLPEYLADMIASSMDDGDSPMFAYRIRAVKNEALAIGYEYFGDSLIEMSDPFEALTQQIEAANMKIEKKSSKK